MDWSKHYPSFAKQSETNETESNTVDAAQNGLSPSAMSRQVEVADIGCGFGGLLFALAPMMPETLILGLEIRTSVTEFVQEKVKALRSQVSETGLYDNVSCIRANTMKFLPNFFRKGQLTKIFLCFPDPHRSMRS